MNRSYCIKCAKSINKKDCAKNKCKKPFTRKLLISPNSKRVIIKRDIEDNKVVFVSSGKVWHCINHEMVLNAKNMEENTVLRHRSNLNCYEDPYRELGFKEYTDKELMLLFLIDPLGVANYVARYAGYIFVKTGFDGEMDYKEYIFELLLKRKPQYFYKILDKEWDIVSEVEDRRNFISEAEIMFGLHFNEYVNPINIDSCTVDVLKAAYGNTVIGDNVRNLYISNVAKSIIYELTTGVKILKKDTKFSEARKTITDKLDGTNLAWSLTWILSRKTNLEIAKSAVKQMNFYVELLDYVINKTGYDVVIKPIGLNAINLKKIRDDIKILEAM